MTAFSVEHLLYIFKISVVIINELTWGHIKISDAYYIAKKLNACNSDQWKP